MPKNDRFPDQFDPPLEYARMHIEVISWVKEARDDDERERLTDLANYYLACAIESGNRNRASIRTGLPADILDALDSGKDLPPERPFHPSEARLVQMCFALSGAATLETLAFGEMESLADIFEGWAQDAKIGPLNAARLLGMADSFRELASVAGPGWKPAPQEP